MMYIKIYKVLIFSILIVVMTATSFADTENNYGTDNNVVRLDDSVRIDSDQEVQSNFYGIGGSVVMSGIVLGDFIGLSSGRVQYNGSVSGDVLALGMDVQINGSTTDDVRIAALETTLSEYVGGSVAVFADTVKILSSAQIEGDVIIFANNLEVSGEISGGIIGRVTEARIDGPVGGSIDIVTNSLVLGSRAVVAGDVIYESPNELIRAQDAVIEGSVFYTAPPVKNLFGRTQSTTFIVIFFSIAFAGLSIFLLMPKRTIRLVYAAKEGISYVGIIGILVILLGLPISIVLLVSGLGTLIGVIVFALYLMTIVLGLIVGVMLVGHLFTKFIFKRPAFDIISIILGSVIAYIALLVPFFGEVFIVLLTAIGVGVISRYLYRFLRL